MTFDKRVMLEILENQTHIMTALATNIVGCMTEAGSKEEFDNLEKQYDNLVDRVKKSVSLINIVTEFEEAKNGE